MTDTWTPEGDGLVVLIPVLGRPANAAKVLRSVSMTAPAARVLFIPDAGDLAEIEAIVAAGGQALDADDGATWGAKINLGIAATDEPLIFTGADDLEFHPGWLDAALEKIEAGAGLVGTNDLTNPRVIAGEHATHFLAARWYAEQGTIDGAPGLCCEVYAHNFVDNELIGTAKRRGAYAMAMDAKVEHLHPLGGKSPDDSTYRKGAGTFRDDRQLHRERRRLWR